MKRAYHFEISDKYREKVTVPENASFELLNLKIWAKIFDLSASPQFQPFFSIYFEKLRERANEDFYNIEIFYFLELCGNSSFDY